MSQETPPIILTTQRLRIVAATPALIRAELTDLDDLAARLDAVVPPDWPPEHHDLDTLRFWLKELSQTDAAGWWLYYAVATNYPKPTLVGSVGFKGQPIDGVVEIGYSVVPSAQGRGFATEAGRALIEEAWKRGARVVIAHTLEHLQPSIGVLNKLGFERGETAETDELEFTLRRS